MNRNTMIGIGAVLVIIVAAAAFPLWRPIFFDDVFDEAFPTLSSEELDQVRLIPEDEQTVLVNMAEDNEEMAVETFRAMMRDDTTADESMEEMATPVAISSGTFGEFDAVHKGSGTATIYTLEDGSRVLRLEEFSVTNGPDLHVILTNSTPTGILDRPEGHIDLGQLKGNVGNQNYEIPADVDLDTFTTVVIYCMPFHVNFSAAALSAAS